MYSRPLPTPAAVAQAARAGSTQDKRIYVGNLPYTVDWKLLKDHMRTAGDVQFAEVLLGPDGRSKGCGIVEYRTPAEAQKAIETLNEQPLNGRQLFIREDREAEPRFGSGPPAGAFGLRGGPPGAGGFRGGPAGLDSGDQVYIAGLPFSWDWRSLKDLVRMTSRVNPRKADIKYTSDGRPSGSGIVQLNSPQDAQVVISTLNNYILEGRTLIAKHDRFAGSDNAGPGGRPVGPGGAVTGVTLSVTGLPPTTHWQDLKDMFRQYANVIRADVGPAPGAAAGAAPPTATGTVVVATGRDAERAVASLNGSLHQGQTVFVTQQSSGTSDDQVVLSVEGLPSTCSWTTLKDTFRPYGAVNRADVNARPDGTAEGLVTFASRDAAQQAINGLNGTQIAGATVTITHSSVQPAPVGAGAGGRVGRPEAAKSTQVFVTNLPWSTTDDDITELFQALGSSKVVAASILFDGERSRGQGIVQFDQVESAEEAIQKFQNYVYGDRPLKIDFNRSWHQFPGQPAQVNGAAPAA